MHTEARQSAPLFRQFLLLAWCAGLFAWRFFTPGLCACLLVFLICLAGAAPALPPPVSRAASGAVSSSVFPPARRAFRWALFSRPAALLAFFALAFGLGLGYAALRAPAVSPLGLAGPDWPRWLHQAVTPNPDNSLYSQGLRLRGRVAEVRGLSDRRLQIILRDLTPLHSLEGGPLPDAAPFFGGLVLSWYEAPTPEAPQSPRPPGQQGQPGRAFGRGAAAENVKAALPTRPLPGQLLELSLRPRLVRSLQNPGLWETESYWQDQNVQLRAWTRGLQAEPLLLNPAPPASPTAGTTAASPEPPEPGHCREKLRQNVNAALPRQSGTNLIAAGADFIPALLLGDRYLQNSAQAELLGRSTLAHSLALSGLHLGYVSALAYALVYLICRLFPGLGGRLPQRRLAVAAALPPALFYVWLGGAGPSLLRAGLMLFFWGLLIFLKRPAVLLDGLLWALFCILLFNPLAIFDLRLQLSALSIGGIALVMPWLGPAGLRLEKRLLAGLAAPSRLRRFLARLARGGLVMLGISFSVQLVLMPLLVNSFGLYGLAFPLNLIWLPVLGFVVMPCVLLGGLAAALNCGQLAGLAFELAARPCAWIMDLLTGLDAAGFMPVIMPTRPHWLFMLGYWLALALLPWLVRKLPRLWRAGKNKDQPRPQAGRGLEQCLAQTPGRAALVALCILSLLLCLAPTALRHYETSRAQLSLRLLDVGHGQAVLLEWPGGGRLLLDGGGVSSPRFDIGREVIAATLADNRPPRLEYMLASHPDRDHVGGLVFPLRHLEVGYFADNGAESPALIPLLEILDARGLPRHSLQAGDALELAPDLRLEILAPFPEGFLEKALEGNDASLVARLVWRPGGFGREVPLALLCGDVEIKAQRQLLRHYRPDQLAAAVLVLPHHGAAGAALREFYQAVNPKLALASAAYAGPWHMPAARTRALLRECGIPLYSTSDWGQIRLDWDLASSPDSGPTVGPVSGPAAGANQGVNQNASPVLNPAPPPAPSQAPPSAPLPRLITARQGPPLQD